MSVVLATAGFDHRIRFWEAPSGVCSKMIKFPDSQVNKLEITPDKQFIAAAGNPVIRLYEIASSSKTTPDQVQQPVLTLEGHTNNVTAVGFQKDGRYLFSGSEDGTIKVWDLRNPHYSRSFDSGSAVNSVCLRVDRDELISGDQNGYVKVRATNLGFAFSASCQTLDSAMNPFGICNLSRCGIWVATDVSTAYDHRRDLQVPLLPRKRRRRRRRRRVKPLQNVPAMTTINELYQSKLWTFPKIHERWSPLAIMGQCTYGIQVVGAFPFLPVMAVMATTMWT